ncbi:MAG: VCBS repeat-containing protein, partial [Planctomycetota bacterium]
MRLPALPLLLLAAPASAQFTSFEEVGSSLVSARDVLVVDFDADGIPDVLSPDVTTRQIILYLGLGGGDFDSGRRLGGGPVTTMDAGPTVLSVGDLDGDGDPDVVGLSEDGESVLLENLGNGTTGPPMQLDFVPSARTSNSLSIELEDIDGDGLLDVVQSTGGPTDLNPGGTFVQLNQGGLSFAPRVPLTSTTQPGGTVRFGDLDGDGDVDALVSHLVGRDFYWVRNDGALPWTQVTMLSTFGTYFDAELGDVDGDGDLDALAVGQTNARVYLLENDGSGGFSSPMVAVPGNTIIGDLVLADVEGDGDLDLVWVRNPGARRLQWAENLGGGVFSDSRNIDAGTGYWRLQVADLDQDGVLDIAAQNPQQTYWLRGSLANPVPSFGPPTPIGTNVPTRAVDVVFVDADGDEDLDIVGVSATLAMFSFIENAGEGDFQTPRIVDTGTGIPFSDLRTADLDGDGDPDFAPVPSTSLPVRWFENLGDFQLGAGAIIESTGTNEVDLHFGDIDGDGDQDAVTLATASGVGEVSWVANPGDGAFGAATAIASFPEGAGTLELADIDLDGVLDILVSDSNNFSRIWSIRGLGGGAFAPPQTILPGNSGRVLGEFTLVDVDDDGLLDVVQIRPQGVDRYQWIRNIGGGSFAVTLNPMTTLSMRFRDIQGADLDADGDTDVLLWNGTFESGMRWLENPSGAGAWSLRNLQTPGTRVLGAAVGDVDCDGDLDLSVGLETRNVGTFENLTLGRISATAICGPPVANSTGMPGRGGGGGGDARARHPRARPAPHQPPHP